MAYLSEDDRQTILNRVHTHFIVNRQPAGRLSGASCIYHSHDDEGRHVSCAIGIFDNDRRLDRKPLVNLSVSDLYDQDPDALFDVFGQADLTISDIGFLAGVQGEHDIAVKNAAGSDRVFDTFFIDELAHRLDRFAGEQGLNSPCSPSSLGTG